MFRPVRLRLAIAVLTSAALLTPQLVTTTYSMASRAIDAEHAAAIDLFDDLRDLLDEETDQGQAIDMYGNAVNAAVATYKLDAAGTLYEMHSPRTELPRLGAPKS